MYIKKRAYGRPQAPRGGGDALIRSAATIAETPATTAPGFLPNVATAATSAYGTIGCVGGRDPAVLNLFIASTGDVG